MARLATILLLLSSAVFMTFSFPIEQQYSSKSAVEQVISAVSRQTRRQRVPIENRLLGELATNEENLQGSVRGTPVATPQIIKLFNQLQGLSAPIGEIRAKLYGPERVRGPERRSLILDEDVLFAQAFFLCIRIERALRRRPGLSGATRQALRTQRRLATEIINARFGTFTV